jgi:pimeloyl-ACP methyl ester carboxylesterase
MPLIRSPIGLVDMVEWGEGGKGMVLLHAAATGPRSLAGLAEQLGRTDRQIIAPAFAGYGQTELSGEVASDRLEANRMIVKEVLQCRQFHQRVLFGHSMGGLIALLTALDEERRGSPFDALILFEPILVDLLDLRQPDQAEAHAWDRAVVDRLVHHIRSGDPEAGVRQFVEAWNETNWEVLPDAARRRLIANADNMAVETDAVSSQKLARAQLGTMTTPTLLLHGNQSPPLVALIAHAAVNAIPNARQCLLTDCGHMAPLLKPATIAACIEKFLQTLASPGQPEATG